MAILHAYDGTETTKHVETLKFAAGQIKAENGGIELASAPYVPPQLDDWTPFDLKEAHDYYLTPRAQHPHAANKMLIQSLPLVLNFDAFQFMEIFLNQPVPLIASEKAGSR